MAELTPSKSIEYLEKMGISSLDEKKDNNLALAIGGMTYGVSPLEMAAAYATIANDGTYIKPTFYTKVEDSDGKVVLEPNQTTEQVCSAETAYIIKSLMQSVINGADGYAGTAKYCAINGIDVAVKTGTTNSSKDRWLCGFTNYYACAAWYGFDNPERINYSGTNPAGQLFSGIMSTIHKGLENSTFKEPEKLVHEKVCRTSGLLATDKCYNTYDEIFSEDHLPEECDAHKSQYTICTESGKLATKYCPSKDRRSSNYVVEIERLGLWTTPGISTTMGSSPTEYCTIHTKPVEETKPTETNVTTDNSNSTNTTKPDTSSGNSENTDSGNTKPDNTKPSTDAGNNDSGNNSTGDNNNPDTGGETTDNNE